MADSEAFPRRPAAEGTSPPAPRTPPDPGRGEPRTGGVGAGDERATRVLVEEITTVQHELARIDGKAATLAALAGAGIAFLVTQLGPGTPVVSGTLLGLAITALTTAVLILLRLLRPIHGGHGGFWAHAGHPSVDALRRWAEQTDRAAAVALLLAAGLSQLITP